MTSFIHTGERTSALLRLPAADAGGAPEDALSWSNGDDDPVGVSLWHQDPRFKDSQPYIDIAGGSESLEIGEAEILAARLLAAIERARRGDR